MVGAYHDHPPRKVLSPGGRYAIELHSAVESRPTYYQASFRVWEEGPPHRVLLNRRFPTIDQEGDTVRWTADERYVALNSYLRPESPILVLDLEKRGFSFLPLRAGACYRVDWLDPTHFVLRCLALPARTANVEGLAVALDELPWRPWADFEKVEDLYGAGLFGPARDRTG